MVSKEDVARVIEDIRGSLQSHGGDIQLVDVLEDGTVKVQLQGACKGCPMSQITISRGVEAALKEEIPEVDHVEAVPTE